MCSSDLVVTCYNSADFRLYERMPQVDGSRAWTLVRRADSALDPEFSEYLKRRGSQDRDLWIVELDIAEGQRFIGLPTASG